MQLCYLRAWIKIVYYIILGYSSKALRKDDKKMIKKVVLVKQS